MGEGAHRLARLRVARLLRQRAPSVDALVEDHLGLHSTDYATPYLSSRARVPGFEAAALARRLDSGDGLVRVNAFRNTVHVVRSQDAPLVVAATGAAVTAVGRRTGSLKGLTDAAFARGIDALEGELAGGPRSSNELKAALPDQAGDLRSWLLAAMGLGRVVRADAAHARSNRTRYARMADRVGSFHTLDPAEARRDVLLRAVRAFGPVTVDDLAWWLPAPKREVNAALAGASGVASLAVDGQTYWFPEDLEPADSDREALGCWLLPYEDSLLKGYRARDWLLAPGVKPVIFPFSVAHWSPPDGVDPGPGPHKGANVTGEARPSVWWAGRVVGRWEERDGGVAWQLHADIGAEGRSAVEAEIARLSAWLREELGPLTGG